VVTFERDLPATTKTVFFFPPASFHQNSTHAGNQDGNAEDDVGAGDATLFCVSAKYMVNNAVVAGGNSGSTHKILLNKYGNDDDGDN
jgi:hypothetical protein